jgi:hypothetical protein
MSGYSEPAAAAKQALNSMGVQLGLEQDVLPDQVSHVISIFRDVLNAKPEQQESKRQYSRSAAPRSYSHSHCRHTLFDDPLFTLLLINDLTTPRYLYRPGAYGLLGSSRGCCFPIQGLGCGKMGKMEDKEMAGLVILAVGATVALSDLAVLSAAGVVTTAAIDLARKANQAHKEANQIASAWQAIGPASNTSQQTEGVSDQQYDAISGALKTAATHLTDITAREARFRSVRAISTTLLCAGGVLAFHALISLIATACLSSSAAVLASSAGLKAIAFFTACYAPPILIAIAVIVGLGLIFATIQRVRAEQNKEVAKTSARDGLEALVPLFKQCQANAHPS